MKPSASSIQSASRITSLCLAFAVGRYNKFLGGALILLSVLLYVLRTAKWQSDFRRLKVETAAAEQARTDFLLDINHEIRSPLNSISLNASRLNHEAGLSVDQAVMARALHKGAEFVISTLTTSWTCPGWMPAHFGCRSSPSMQGR